MYRFEWLVFFNWVFNQSLVRKVGRAIRRRRISWEFVTFARVGDLVESRYDVGRSHIVCDISRQRDMNSNVWAPSRWSYLLDNGEWVMAIEWVVV